MKLTRKKKSTIIIGSIIAIIAIGVAVFFGARGIYQNGINNGRKFEAEEISERLKSLGNAVAEKENFKNELNSLFNDFPSEINGDGIDLYIEKITNLVNNVSTEKIKTLLEKYLDEWKNFKDVYAGEDNNEISENFNQLKMKAEELSAKIKTTFDESIKEALDNL